MKVLITNFFREGIFHITMSTPHRRWAKRGRGTLRAYFQPQQPDQIEEGSTSNVPFTSPSNDWIHEVPVVNYEHEEVGGQRTEFEAMSTQCVPEVVENAYVSSLERDPGLRTPIMQYPVNKRDEVRRSYLQMGRNVTRLVKYPDEFVALKERKVKLKE
ncbi:hypothetical protein MKW98_012645 [Papaver atlanticum]|uniref:Uncharacterized protein n=1 Tax=Papaver atlanticum TaxID=357466 RepID=A0AAD4T2C4_9MAGN|nr:hypothetical protein MKW98_012645 [Papaver atlanticum]